MTNFTRFSALTCLTLSALAGCGFELGEDTTGDRGRLEFSYTEECLFGCSVRQPMMAGSTEEIRVTGKRVRRGEVTVESSNESVLTFVGERRCDEDTCSALVDVTAHAPGEAELIVRDTDGDLVDRVTIEVRAPASFDIEASVETSANFTAGTEFSMRTGQTLFMRTTVRDADGEQLRVSSGLVWKIETPELAQFNEWERDPEGKEFLNPDDDDMQLEATAAGEVIVVVSAEDVEQSFSITVVD